MLKIESTFRISVVWVLGSPSLWKVKSEMICQMLLGKKVMSQTFEMLFFFLVVVFAHWLDMWKESLHTKIYSFFFFHFGIF